LNKIADSLFPDYNLAIEANAVTPALKWAGGKRWLLPHLQPIWQQFQSRRLVEPFVGGMGVALGLKPAQALLSDSNEHLVNFYQWLQKGLVSNADFRNEEFAFYEARTQFNNLVKSGEARSKEAAELFYYLNRTCFNGLCRFNSRNEFNVPFGRYKKINYTQDFTPYRQQFSKWQIACHDFEETRVETNDFLYVDPPYDTPFTQYRKEDFTWADQLRLIAWLTCQKVPMVVTNQATPRIIDAYQTAGFSITTLLAPRRIASSGDRTPALEMLATKNI
jgi:DNA adenine methylase